MTSTARAATPPTRPGPAGTATGQIPERWQRKIDEAIRHAEDVCRAAWNTTPERYRAFLVYIDQKKKVGAERIGGQWVDYKADVRVPYLSVDGKVLWLVDEHLAQGKTVTVSEPRIYAEPVTGHTLVDVTVTAPLRGTATGTARIVQAPSGVNSSNPVENGITSAIGRAISALGIGLYGTGIASADEVANALRQQGESVTQTPATSAGTATTPATSHNGARSSGREAAPSTNGTRPSAVDASPALSEDVQALAATLGLDAGAIDLLRAQTPDDAALLTLLKQKVADRERSTADTTTAIATPGASSEARAALVAGQIQKAQLLGLAPALGVRPEAYGAYLKKTFNADSAAQLTDGQFAKEVELLNKRLGDPAEAKRFRDRLARLATVA